MVTTTAPNDSSPSMTLAVVVEHLHGGSTGVDDDDGKKEKQSGKNLHCSANVLFSKCVTRRTLSCVHLEVPSIVVTGILPSTW